MGMDEETLAKWIRLGSRIATAGPEKFGDVIADLSEMVEALEIIAEYDDQLFLRGGKRPTKRYRA